MPEQSFFSMLKEKPSPNPQEFSCVYFKLSTNVSAMLSSVFNGLMVLQFHDWVKENSCGFGCPNTLFFQLNLVECTSFSLFLSVVQHDVLYLCKRNYLQVKSSLYTIQKYCVCSMHSKDSHGGFDNSLPVLRTFLRLKSFTSQYIVIYQPDLFKIILHYRVL